MKPFSLRKITHSNELATISTFDSSRFLAGGTNLVDLMKHQVEAPDQVVDLSQWQPDSRINQSADEYVIDAMVTNTQLANFAYTRPDLAVLSQALLSGATVQLRNRATTAGNLLQRTRCYYFYDVSKPCNKRAPASGCAAKQGFNRNHAILGTSDHCIASHPSDMAVAMTLLDATVTTRNRSGESRKIPVRELYRLPGDTPHIDTHLQADELITHIHLPKQARGSQLYRKVRDRASYAFALVSVGCTLRLKDKAISDIQIAFGGVASRPWYAEKARHFLLNQRVTDDNLSQAIEAELQDATTFKHNRFKIALLENTFKDVVNQLYQHQLSHPQHQGALYAS